MKSVNKAVRKKDAMELLLGKPVYTDDIAPKDCLVVKLLRSPYANAYVKSINTDIAMKVPGIEAIYTYKDVDQNMKRFTCAGQTYPEPSPYDRLILDKHVRFIGDPVAIVAGVDERCVDKAMKLIKAEYEVLEPVLDFTSCSFNTTSLKLALSISMSVTKIILGSLYFSHISHALFVPVCMPALPETTMIAASAADTASSTSPTKSKKPGVSRIFILTLSHSIGTTDVCIEN